MPDSFAHLHVHTEYSLLDGASRLSELVDAAARDDQPALGITDHGNMYGVVEFYRACHDRGIKPIIGTEAYMAHEHREERPVRRGKVDDTGGSTSQGAKLYYHLTLLAENDIGYKNLIQVASRAFLEGYYYKPRVDWEVLSQHSEGLIATTGCLGSHVNQALMQGTPKQALEYASRLRDIFGKESFFVELQDHGIPAQHENLKNLLEIGRRLEVPLLATNDTHYTHRSDAVSHDVLLCVQTGAHVADENRLKFHGDQHYLKSAREMRELFNELPQACDNTLQIAERCDVEIKFGEPQLPAFPLPGGMDSEDDYLSDLTLKGAKKRWGHSFSDEIADRLSYELRVISDMGFSAYFLIVWDLVRYAKEHGIRVGPGRGSAAGSAVSYCLDITDLDPIRYDLLFERFLNPGRRQMPDIDIDFDSRYRDELIRYLSDFYGREQVAQIITFARIKARQAVRDSARVLGFPYGLGDRIAKAIPPLILGRDTPLHACFEKKEGYEAGFSQAGDLRAMYEENEEARQVIDAAKGIEGLCRQDSIHAAAVVLTKEPITNYMPIQRKPASGEEPDDAPIITQFEMGAVEDMGLLKMDLLGLRNLDIVSDTLKIIARTQGSELVIEDIPLDDEPTYELLRQGDTTGVFQLESGPMRLLMRSLAPTEFEDIAALVALYRPGPMEAKMHEAYADRKNRREEVKYLHPDAEEILQETYGLMIYQESMMRIAQKFAGYSLDDADSLRKACGKKIREVMRKEKEKFVEGCTRNGYGEKLGKQWWEIIEPFADYAFNKSHSYSYGMLAYQTAYLKANYPVEYFAALLTSGKTDQDRTRMYLAECRQKNILVSPPDINRSEVDFSVVSQPDGTDGISFGLSAVRNIGTVHSEMLIQERSENGPYENFYDFAERVPRMCLNKRMVESLIKAGSFDALPHNRESLMGAFEAIIENSVQNRDAQDRGFVSLFGEESEAVRPPILSLPERPAQRLQDEKNMLGLYISSHPLDGYERIMKQKSTVSLAELLETSDGSTHTVAGMLSSANVRTTRNGTTMLSGVLEDFERTVEIVVFSGNYDKYQDVLEEDTAIAVAGRVDRSRDSFQLIVSSAEKLPAPRKQAPAACVHCSEEHLSMESLVALKDFLWENPGDIDLLINLGGGSLLATSKQVSEEALTELPRLLGECRVSRMQQPVGI